MNAVSIVTNRMWLRYALSCNFHKGTEVSIRPSSFANKTPTIDVKGVALAAMLLV